MQEVKLKILGLVYNQSVVTSYGLILGEEAGTRRFSVMIGEAEAQSIALKINNKQIVRPLTHDLIKNLFQILKVDLTKILIYNLVNDVFCSKLYLKTEAGETLVVDARTSDAVAIAVRAECPIYIKKEILDIVGTEVAAEPAFEDSPHDLNDLDTFTEEKLILFSENELKELLEQAVKEERYELAVKLRNTINKKKHNN